MLEADALLSAVWYLRCRSMRTDTFQTLHAWRDLMMDTISLRCDPQWIPIPELDHIETRAFPDRLNSVRAGWHITRMLPILLYEGRERLELLNGNHRLTNARAMEVDAIRGAIIPFHAEYTDALQAHLDYMEAIRLEDLSMIY